MTIDEAIEIQNKAVRLYKLGDEKVFSEYIEQHEQIAEWLEELKAYKESLALKKEYYCGYNQALEDMQKGIKEILEDNAIYNIDCIDTLVKQLSK